MFEAKASCSPSALANEWLSLAKPGQRASCSLNLSTHVRPKYILVLSRSPDKIGL